MTRDNEMVYVGVDYHRDPLQVAVKSADGRPLANRRCANDVSSVVALVSRHGRVSKVAVEACCGSMSFAEELAERTGWTVELAHPGVTRRMRQRHEGLPAPRPAEPHMVLHHRVAAGKAVLVTKALEDPLRRMTLLHR